MLWSIVDLVEIHLQIIGATMEIEIIEMQEEQKLEDLECLKETMTNMHKQEDLEVDMLMKVEEAFMSIETQELQTSLFV